MINRNQWSDKEEWSQWCYTCKGLIRKDSKYEGPKEEQLQAKQTFIERRGFAEVKTSLCSLQPHFRTPQYQHPEKSWRANSPIK